MSVVSCFVRGHATYLSNCTARAASRSYPFKNLGRHLDRSALSPTSNRHYRLSTQWRTSHAQTAKDLNQQGVDEALSDYGKDVSSAKDKLSSAPWHREGSDRKPVEQQGTGSTMTKGKLLTTPSRLLKLVLPLNNLKGNSHKDNIAPLALLIHPQQPLSYLERLIQSEIPRITNKDGNKEAPAVSFRAMESKDTELQPNKEKAPDEPQHTDKSSGKPLSDGAVQSYSAAGREGEGNDNGEFVRWSASTEIGDFIRDAARAKEFEVEIEGSSNVIKVGVPSFNDRTYYLRQRLRRTSARIASMGQIKTECDKAAHLAGQRLAIGGCVALVGYWTAVYILTFKTDLGWDVMEPVTYLIGLSTLIGGYMWFLYHNREASYRAALHLTVSRRQSKLYEMKGFDLHTWENLIEEGNAIRREIKAVAAEYDVEYDEKADEKNELVTKALRRDRQRHKRSSKGDDEDDDTAEDDNDTDKKNK